jgi:hypothetical protein
MRVCKRIIHLFSVFALSVALLVAGCFNLHMPPRPDAAGGSGKGGKEDASGSVKDGASENEDNGSAKDGASNNGGSGGVSDAGGSGGGGLKNGESCEARTDCESGNCVDSVCCESKCDGVCQTCDGDIDGSNIIEKTELAIRGKCIPYNQGLDIANECPDIGLCKAECDGNGACRVNQGAGQAESCLEDGADCSATNENEQCAGGKCFDGLCGAPCTCSDKNECCNGCYPINEDGSCDDGLYCNGDDTCNEYGNCSHAGDPCANGDVCIQCEEAGKTCTRSTNIIWYDSTSKLSWVMTPSYSTEVVWRWQAAVDYCNGLTLCGYDGWRLPSISELRSLIRSCAETQTDGSCGVTDSCSSSSCYTSCNSCTVGQGPGAGGCYWPTQIEGTCGWFWSSSFYADVTDLVWYVDFGSGNVSGAGKDSAGFVRCVRGGP